MARSEKFAGKVYTTNFVKFTDIWEMFEGRKNFQGTETDFYAVTRTHSWMRGKGDSADCRRAHIKWLPVLAPSRELHRKATHGLVTWEDFLASYLEEIEGEEQQKAILDLANCVAAGRNVVLMCYERKGERCHRYPLAEIVVERAKATLYGTGYNNGSPVGGEIYRDNLSPKHTGGYHRFG